MEKRNEQDGLSTATVGWLHTLRLKLTSLGWLSWVYTGGVSEPTLSLSVVCDYPPSGQVDGTGWHWEIFLFFSSSNRRRHIKNS
jgi:hypothetical protein